MNSFISFSFFFFLNLVHWMQPVTIIILQCFFLLRAMSLFLIAIQIMCVRNVCKYGWWIDPNITLQRANKSSILQLPFKMKLFYFLFYLIIYLLYSYLLKSILSLFFWDLKKLSWLWICVDDCSLNYFVIKWTEIKKCKNFSEFQIIIQSITYVTFHAKECLRKCQKRAICFLFQLTENTIQSCSHQNEIYCLNSKADMILHTS